MIIHSTTRLLWPNFPDFVIAIGRNDIDESDIPPRIHRKLAHYAKSRVLRGYEPSAEFLALAEQHMRPLNPPATLKTLQADATKAGAR